MQAAEIGPAGQFRLSTPEKPKSLLHCLFAPLEHFVVYSSALPLPPSPHLPQSMSHSLPVRIPSRGTQAQNRRVQASQRRPVAGSLKRMEQDAADFRVKCPAYPWPPGSQSPPMGADRRASYAEFSASGVSQVPYCIPGVVVPTGISPVLAHSVCTVVSCKQRKTLYKNPRK